MMKMQEHKEKPADEVQTHFSIGSCVLVKDQARSEIRLNSGGTFSLTHPESAILHLLYLNEGQIVNKHDLIIAGWVRPDIIGVNSLPVAMSNIRKILKLANVDIINIPRVGYKLEVNSSPPETSLESPNVMLKSKPSLSQSRLPSLFKFRFKISIGLFISILTILFLIWLSVFTSMSWVTIVCQDFEKAQFCYNTKENNKPWPLPKDFPPEQGQHYFYSHGNWLPTKSISDE